MIEDGKEIVVKKFFIRYRQGKDEFINEDKMLAKI